MTREFKHHVAVLIPANGFWRQEFGKSLAQMVAYEGSRPDADTQVSIICRGGSMLASQRFYLLKEAIKAKATHALFLDSDMVFPRDTMKRLLKFDKPFVGANCTTRTMPVKPVAFDLNGKRIDSRGKFGLQKVRFVGCAVAMINLDVVKPLQPPFFLQDWIPELQDTCGEDVYFCQKLAEAKVDMFVDHELSVKIGHVGYQICGHHMVADEVFQESA
jgi:hypothetical protein